MKQIVSLIFSLLMFNWVVSAQEVKPPHAEKHPHQTIIHQDTLVDDYFWMRDKYSAEVLNYLYANNAHADAVMKPFTVLQKVIYDEMRSRMVESKDSRPSKNKNYYYFTRTTKDDNYPAIYRKKDSLTAPEQLVLNLNELAKNYPYFSIGVYSLSPNQQLLAYGIDDKGHNISKLFIKHIDKDSILTVDTIPAMVGFVWCENNESFYYTVPEAKTNRSHRVYRHILGRHYTEDELILEELDPTYAVSCGKTTSKKYITFSISKTKSNEVHYIDAHATTGKPVLYMKRTPDVLYTLNHYEGNDFYVSTNYKAINYRYVKTPINNANPDKWIDVISPRKDVLLEAVNQTKNFLFYQEKQNAQSRIIIKNKQTLITDTIKPPLSIYSIGWSFDEYEYETTNQFLYSVSNDITPLTKYKYDFVTKDVEFVEKDSLNVPYNSDEYETVRIYAPSHDGLKIPITLAYKKGIKLNGNNPVLLNAYGSYGASHDVGFSLSDVSFLNRGFVLATAHIRGSNDLGMQWYEDGKMLVKKNTFLDFIACAEYLINQKYTNPKKLAIQGGSAGGLLMGAVSNMRPDLFKCVVANVPFVDMINTMLDETLPLTTFEFEEWGNPKQKKYYDYMKSYSPYNNVERKNYPSMLVTAGYNDAQVSYWEPAKWVAKLRELKTDTNHILFKTTMAGGHQGSSGRYESLKESAFQLAYIMKELGVKEEYVNIKGKLIDGNDMPVEFANVYIEGTNIGTNSNTEGEFTLRLKSTENAVLVVQCIGFEKKKMPIDINTRVSDMLIKLRSDNVLLKAAVITADGKDPAIGIMRKAVQMRKKNYDKVKSFSADVYMKSQVRLNEFPEKLPAFIRLVSNEKLDSNLLGILYLSESVAKYHFEKPDKVKETMIASRVAGEKQGFSFNRVEDVFINFYEPTVKLSYYSDRPFVSPVSPLANINYKFKFQGTFTSDGKDIYKIQVTPLRKGDPLFNGYIYISNDDYQIYGIDFFITKDAQIEFVDTLYLQQEMITENNILVPLQLKLHSQVKIFGIKATDLSVANMSNYQVNNEYAKNFFNYEVFSIDKAANKKDTQYWSSTRTIVLTEEEEKHYVKSDSIYAAQNTPEYLDSLNRVRNKLKIGKLFWGGYTHTVNSDTSLRRLSFSPFLSSIGYNTVEGMFLNYNMTWYKLNKETRNYTYIQPSIRYGFINENLTGGLQMVRMLNAKTSTSIGFVGGIYIQQYNNAEPIVSVINAAYTLFDRLNYAKYLQKEVIGLSFNRELFNGFYGKAGVQWHNRVALTNHADYSFAKASKRDFTSNNPINPLNDAAAFLTHQTIEYSLGVRFVPQQRYESYPTFKRIIGSKYPDIYLHFNHGMAINTLNFNYQKLEIGTGKDVDLKLFGEFSFDVNAGMFFNTSSMTFADYKHFNGNQTFILYNPRNANSIGDNSRNRLTSFHALTYYGLSTNKQYVEAHAKQNCKGFFISKFPLLRKTRAYELVGLNYLQSDKTTYTEMYLGLEHIFSVLRVDAGRVLSNSNMNGWFFRFGLSLEF
jgi:oligopeptidase B